MTASISFVDLSLDKIHILMYSTFTTEIEFPFQEREAGENTVQFRNNQDTLTLIRQDPSTIRIVHVQTGSGAVTTTTTYPSINCSETFWNRIIAEPGKAPKKQSRGIETPPIRRRAQGGEGDDGLYGGERLQFSFYYLD